MQLLGIDLGSISIGQSHDQILSSSGRFVLSRMANDRGSPAAALHGAFYISRRPSAAVGCSRLLGGPSSATLAP